ncbi:uncharacterized protein [Typha latifolia]|uniref:uncharacterized protein isoform X2 n=1 Tax=Typha latifolia TaxID=4733 RepID=UPI003C2E1E3A
MADGGEKGGGDLYAVLGLNKECSDAELRNAYKKLAMRIWDYSSVSIAYPIDLSGFLDGRDGIRISAPLPGTPTSKKLRKNSKRSKELIPGMADFLGEMAQMMSQTKPNESAHESFEELQQLFVDMFQADLDGGFCGAQRNDGFDRFAPPSASSSSPSGSPFCNGGSKRGNSEMNSGKSKLGELDRSSAGFCAGSNDSGQSSKGRGGSNNKRRNGRKQKISSKHDVSSRDAGISA